MPLTFDLTVDLQNKCLQQLHLLTLHFEIEGYIALFLYLLLGRLQSRRRFFKI